MISGIALRTELLKTELGAADPVDTLLDDYGRNHYAATYNGTNITVGQLVTGQWYQSFPQDAGDDYVNYAGTINAPWYVKAFKVWYCPIAELTEGAISENIILSKHTSVTHGFYRDANHSPNRIWFNMEDSLGGNNILSWSITDYTAWYHLFGYMRSDGKRRVIINDIYSHTGAGISPDNHGSGTNVTASPVRVGGGVANRYDTCFIAEPKLFVGEMTRGEDDWWDDLAYRMFNSEKHLFGY